MNRNIECSEGGQRHVYFPSGHEAHPAPAGKGDPALALRLRRAGRAPGDARRAGLETAFLTARTSQIVEARARELGIALVCQGRKDKLQGLSEVLSAAGLEALSAAYMGDDLIDLAAMVRCGLSGCPADACPEVRGRAHFVAGSPGGSGAVREFIEMILKAQGKWEALAEGFPMR